jgi:CRP-like cAMP-binding protein
MDLKINPNAVNQFPEGTVIYKEGEPVFSVAMIIKGRVLIHNDGARIIMSPGSFLGVNDLYQGRYQCTYTACEDLMVYVYPVKRIDELEVILSSNKDYHGYMVASFYKIIYELEQIYWD